MLKVSFHKSSWHSVCFSYITVYHITASKLWAGKEVSVWESGIWAGLSEEGSSLLHILSAGLMWVSLRYPRCPRPYAQHFCAACSYSHLVLQHVTYLFVCGLSSFGSHGLLVFQEDECRGGKSSSGPGRKVTGHFCSILLA